MTQIARLFDILEYQLNKYPKTDCLAAKAGDKWEHHSTADVWAQAEKLGAWFLKNGLGGSAALPIEERDKVAVISRNRPEWMVLDLACQMSGVVLCPIYPTTHINELEFIFNDAGIKQVFISGEDINHKITAVRPRIPSLWNVYGFDHLPGTEFWKTQLDGITDADVARLREVRALIDAASCVTIIYTSGTTGTPKGVMLSHHNIVSNVLNACKSFPFTENPTYRALSFLPLNHIFERMISYIYFYTGIGIYYAESLEKVGENLPEVKPHLFCTVPRLLEKVYERIMAKGKELTGVKKNLFYWALDLAEKYDNNRSGGIVYDAKLALANRLIFSKWREALGGNMKLIITGGAAASERLIRIFNAAQIPVYEGYGPTENSPVISVNRKEPKGAKFGTVGPVIEGQELKLMADGEICVKGPSVMMGYYKRPDLTAETVIDGWLHTGDIGVLEDGKFLRITDRKKELFKTSGGKYVAPQPVENKLKESPYVEQIIVLGAEQKFVGALIVPSFANLKEWMREQNLSFSTPEAAIAQPEVIAFFRELVDSFNKYFNHVEQIKKFELLPAEWTVDTGELTPTLKMKRKIILEKYRDAVDRIYN